MRVSFIHRSPRGYGNKTESKGTRPQREIDRVLTGRYTAIPAFVCIMGLVFWLTFGVIGSFLSDLLDSGLGWVTELVDHSLEVYRINPVVHSLVIDGIFKGVGSVLAFLL